MKKYNSAEDHYASLERKEGRLDNLLSRIYKRGDKLNENAKYALKNKDYDTAEKLTDKSIALYKKEERLIDKLKEINFEMTKSALAMAIIGILGGLLFFSPNVTGNAISSLTTTNSNAIGVALFFIGLIGCFFGSIKDNFNHQNYQEY
jgi:hypothetical protein